MSEKNINVLLVDDHSVVRQECRTILSQRKGVTVIGEAASGHEAIEKPTRYGLTLWSWTSIFQG